MVAAPSSIPVTSKNIANRGLIANTIERARQIYEYLRGTSIVDREG